MGEVPLGIVKWFNDAKGYGFITQEDGGDIFVHYTAIQQEGFKSLKEGDNVEFEVSQGPKGLQAADVRLPGSGSGAGAESAETEPAGAESETEAEAE